MKKLSAVLIFGFLPVWIAVAIMISGALIAQGPASSYWIAAPWILFFAVPCCFVTVPLAILATRKKTLGDVAEQSASTFNEMKSDVMVEWRHWPNRSFPATLQEIRAFHDWLAKERPALLYHRGTRIGWSDIQSWLAPD